MKRKILHDVYEISKRVRAIESHYYIVYDTENAKFEVHNSAQTDGTYCVSLPYNTLDVRALNYVNKTRSSNASRIFNEIENENKLIQNEATRSVQNEMNEAVESELKRS